MAEAPLAVASAVIMPEESMEQPSISPTTLKRRQSSFSEDRAKRPRLSHDASNSNGNDKRDSAAAPLDTSGDGRQAERRRSGHMEERKRGQRLFGALLGTLSQSSSSTAQKRRTDIEKKQQAKLKMQAEEQDERKKLKREGLDAVRRLEQKKYDRQSMQIRHSNILAQAHFLHTKAEPRLYYKPWELLASEEKRIKDQIKEATMTVERESEQWDAENPSVEQEVLSDAQTEHPVPEKETNARVETVGSSTNDGKPSSPKTSVDTNMNNTASPGTQKKTPEPPESSKDQGDDGGEVVEGEEDTVIY